MLGDAILAIVLLVMGGYILNEVNAYPDYSNLSVIGPEVFPKLIAIFFIISAIWFLATVIWKGWIKMVIHWQRRGMRDRQSVSLHTAHSSVVLLVLSCYLWDVVHFH